MKFTVTALGAEAGSVGDAARRISQYLMGKAPDPNRPMVGQFTTEQPARAIAGYYQADQLEGDGWWGGLGAARLGLAGTVDASDLESLLSGRHHLTGERLISAAGASGRRSLRRGQHTRFVDGEPVWSLADAAARLDTQRSEVMTLVDQLDDAAFIIDPDGGRWLTDDGLDQLIELHIERLSESGYRDVRDQLAGAPAELTTTEAARLTGTSERHIRKIIDEWLTNQDAIAAGDAGQQLPHKRAWLPARRHGKRWLINRDDLIAYWERRQPPAVRQAYDVVATVEKSVSLLTLLSGSDTKRRCVDAIVAANRTGMDHLDQHASRGRRKGSSVSSEGFVWASFMHATSRSLDPHPHIHNVVMNFLEDPFGQRRAVDARFLFTEAKAASALATAQLRWELHQAFPGLRWERHTRTGVWEIAGVSRELIKEFSTRRAEIEAAARHLVGPDGTLPTRAELQEISRTTRSAKTVVDAATVLADWMARAAAVGFDEHAIVNQAPADGTRRWPPRLSETETVALFEFLATSPDGACNEESTFSYGDLLAAINRWNPNGQPRPLPAETVASLANDFLATPLALPVDHDAGLITRRDGRTVGRVVKQERWTTPDMVRTQVAIVTWWGTGINRRFLLDVEAATIDQICETEGVGPEQADLIRSWSASGDQFQAAIGQPGTGKTFTMRAARQIWEHHGHRVLGAAVKGTAAQHLARETGIPCETVAHYLRAATLGIAKLDARTVLVIDEATTLSDRDLRALMHLCRQTGAVLRMIGDPAQQQSVAAGGMWEHMVGRYRSRTPELSHQRRLQDPHEIRTAQLLRLGQIDDAFNALLETGKIKQAEDPTQGELIALAGWLDRLQRGIHAPMIDRRNAARERLNLIAQLVRIKAGQVTDLQRYGEREFGVGDEVVATQPNRKLFPDGAPRNYLSNGSTGTITATSAAALTVRFAGLGDITIPAATVRTHVDLGYAITAFSVQGLTLDEAEATARPGEELHSLYVMLTRGRHSNTLITTRPLSGESHGVNVQPQQLPVVEVADTIADTTLKPAIVADTLLPHLLIDAPGAAAAADTEAIQQRIADTELQRVARHALNHPPTAFRDTFPPRPATPWLARKWEASLQTAVVYLHLWQPEELDNEATKGHPFLGPEPPAASGQHRDWAEANETLTQNAVTIALHHLSKAGYQTRTATAEDQIGRPSASDRSASTRKSIPTWISDHLHARAGTGAIDHRTDFRALAYWLTRVAEARAQAGLNEDQLLADLDAIGSADHQELVELINRDPLAHRPSRAVLTL